MVSDHFDKGVMRNSSQGLPGQVMELYRKKKKVTRKNWGSRGKLVKKREMRYSVASC